MPTIDKCTLKGGYGAAALKLVYTIKSNQKPFLSPYLLPHSALLAHARFSIDEHVIIDKKDIARARWSLQGSEPIVIVLSERFIQGCAWKQDDASFASL